MKMRRVTSVNGEREDCKRFAVNQGGTAETFGPFRGVKGWAFLYYKNTLGPE